MSPAQAVAIASLADYEPLARERLDAATWAYFNGGAGDEITLRANAADWAALRLLPRVLQPLDGAHTRVELLGRILAHPLLMAPMAWQRLLHPDAETGMAVAASAQEAGYVLSTQTSTPPETVARATPSGAAASGCRPAWRPWRCQRPARHRQAPPGSCVTCAAHPPGPASRNSSPGHGCRCC